jgi:uncharacterized membrane protein
VRSCGRQWELRRALYFFAMKHSSKTVAARAAVYALDAHHRLSIACLLAGLTFLVLYARYTWPTVLVVTWNVFAATLVVLSWSIIVRKDPYEARRTVRLQDASATAIFSLVITAATVSLFAVGLLLGSAKNLPPTALALHVALSVTAVVISWVLVHTVFTLRYAHLYYWDAGKVERHAVVGGLMFPGKGHPCYIDFAYFSFVIGMTCQVSDVQIATSQMRRLALVHGLISFAFNTAILAMFVNIVAGLV